MADNVNDRFLAKLATIDQRYDELHERMADPAVATNPVKSIEISKEVGKLRRVIEPYRGLMACKKQLSEAQAILEGNGQDPELVALAETEVEELAGRFEEMLESLKEKLVTSEDAAISSIILEIRAGTGGDEAALFARDLYEMYLRFCQAKRYKVEVLEQSGGELGGLKEVILSIEGEGVYMDLGYEGGGHRVQRVPETEAQGRVHTSAATVAVLPEPEEVDIKINWESDVEEHVSRAGGPGGQNVNKVSSAIRLVHTATGITVSMRDEKSQHKNRAKARRVMLSRLYDHHIQKISSQRDSTRRIMIGSGDRSERIRTYNFPQNRCTDHRINLTLYSLDRIMQGDLDDLISALQTYDKEQRLKNF